MKTMTIRVDITNPNRPFVHKGWARKGHTYASFRLAKVTKGNHLDLLKVVLASNSYVVPN